MPPHSPEDLTARQRLMQALTGSLRSTRELARDLGLPEREVEAHLAHVVRSLKHDSTRRFLMEPSTCHGCGFVFRERRKLSRPSRCPRCREESVVPPRFGIESTAR